MVCTDPVGTFVPNTTMDPDCDPPSASLNPLAHIGPRVITAPPEVTDEDLAWLNARSLGVKVEREAPKTGKLPADTSWLVDTQIRG